MSDDTKYVKFTCPECEEEMEEYSIESAKYFEEGFYCKWCGLGMVKRIDREKEK